MKFEVKNRFSGKVRFEAEDIREQAALQTNGSPQAPVAGGK